MVAPNNAGQAGRVRRFGCPNLPPLRTGRASFPASGSRRASTVTFASTDPGAQLPHDYTFTAGDAGTQDFATTLYASGLTVTLFASDPTNTLSASVDVLVS
jgi:hypothetical protein